MPTPYIKKMAKKHKMSVGKSEGKWSEAKAIAGKEGKGDNFAYVTGIYKKMIGENFNVGSLKSFLSEDDYESTSGQKSSIQPDEDAGYEDPMAFADQQADLDAQAYGSKMGREERGPEEFGAGAAPQPIDLDNDERFLELPRQERFRLKQFARTAQPQEVEDMLQQTWERVSGGSNIGGAAQQPELEDAFESKSFLARLLNEGSFCDTVMNYIDQNFYVYNDGRPGSWVIEETKRKYTIDFNENGYLNVTAHQDTGATPRRAKEIKQEILGNCSF